MTAPTPAPVADPRRHGFRLLTKGVGLFVGGVCVGGGLLAVLKLVPDLKDRAFAFLFIGVAVCGVVAVSGFAFCAQGVGLILFRNDRIGVIAGIVLALLAFPLSIACYYWFR